MFKIDYERNQKDINVLGESKGVKLEKDAVFTPNEHHKCL